MNISEKLLRMGRMEVANMMGAEDAKNVIDKRKLTWSKPNGTWGLKNYDIHDVPKELYGPLYKLHNYEKTGLSPEEVEDLKERQQSSRYCGESSRYCGESSRYCGEEKQLIEAMAEEIENCYGRETELSERARDYLDKTDYDGGWIPCSERFPEKNVPVLCWVRSTTIASGETYIIGSCDNGFWFLKTYEIGSHSFPVKDYKVIAWQPLPEPYKGEEEER